MTVQAVRLRMDSDNDTIHGADQIYKQKDHGDSRSGRFIRTDNGHRSEAQ